MSKRFLLTMLLLAALISTLLTFPASAETLSGTCGAEGDNLTWALDTSSHTLTISGTGAMEDYSLSVKSSPWTGNVIRTVIIEPGVTSIGKTAFYCISDIKTLTIPDGLETIGSLAFYYCEKLESIALPQSLQSIGDKAFFSCTALLTVYNCSSLPLVKGSADHG